MVIKLTPDEVLKIVSLWIAENVPVLSKEKVLVTAVVGRSEDEPGKITVWYEAELKE